jgi:cullin-4
VGKDPEKGGGAGGGNGGGGGGGGATAAAAAPDREADKNLIGLLLDFKASCDAVVTRSFCGSPVFSNALKSALVLCINSRADKAAELLAKWVDARMRAAGGAGWEVEQEKAMDRALALFRLIHGKDVFEAFYKKDLAKRLLLGRSTSTDLEKAMVVRLKGECGAAFTAKLECMFKDVEVSRAISDEFRGGDAPPGSPRSGGSGSGSPAAGGGGAGGGSPAAGGGGDGGDFFVHLLTATHWPSYPMSPELRLPPELAPLAAAFDAFYKKKHSSRKIAWVSQLGSCVLRAAFPSGRKELDVSQHQAMALLLFNGGGSAAGEGPTLTAGAIRAATGIEAEELKRTLQSLALGQVRVLKKEPKGRDVADSDAFSVNAAFSHNLVRIKVNQIQHSETKAEAEDTNERVASDRLYQIDAAIVRVLKARKTLEHTALMGELLAQLRFPAQTADIKKRLESLIERDYISRDGRDAKVYHYAA